MKKSFALVSLIWFVVTTTVTQAQISSVDFSQAVYNYREQVTATVGAYGTVGVESDFTKSSFSVNTSGQRLVEFGLVTAPGFYFVRFLH